MLPSENKVFIIIIIIITHQDGSRPEGGAAGGLGGLQRDGRAVDHQH